MKTDVQHCVDFLNKGIQVFKNNLSKAYSFFTMFSFPPPNFSESVVLFFAPPPTPIATFLQL